ncbi:Rrf2 family transcriptional regulator [Rickettsiales bacterium]|nr:Rrf2 family transcriptional regulator [Rickettsiales bacterium]MDB2550486.1 Rrf2 family transcriptional regulator [Rickettsiales bacterium]
MILTSKGRYAVETMSQMAQLSEDNKPVSLALIAKEQQKSFSYLERLFAQLRKAKIVDSVKGPGGGYIFLKEYSNITIYEIILAVEESIKMTSCTKTQNCFGKSTKCQTHKLWKGLENNIKSYLESVTINDLKKI